MQALITGASSGMGEEMAKYLGGMGWDLILVARNKDKLNTVKNSLPKNINVTVIPADLSHPENAKELFHKVKDMPVDMLINNAGFGIFGEFADVDLDREIQLINTNVTSVHILTKLFLQKFLKEDKGRIINVASSAGFLAGPLMSSYYASKNYVLRLTQAIYEELRRKKSNVHISCFCPGPVKTNFNDVAGVRFAIKGIDGGYAARYCIDKAFKNKMIIMPSLTMKGANFLMRFVSQKRLTRINYNIQKKK
ncbi:MAG: SDR family NAD(P)-dependent oxidoreductase [Ruminococcus sp.]